jgi:hypothetical protein
LIDLRSWPKKWNDAGLRDIAILPEGSRSGPWPMVGILALGLVAGAVLGGYAVSQRSQMKRLARHAYEMGDELADMGKLEDKPVEASNHRRKATSEV